MDATARFLPRYFILKSQYCLGAFHCIFTSSFSFSLFLNAVPKPSVKLFHNLVSSYPKKIYFEGLFFPCFHTVSSLCHSPLPTQYFLLPTPYSLLPTPYSILPTQYSLLPTPYSTLNIHISFNEYPLYSTL